MPISRPCQACVWAAEAVERWQQGDLTGTQASDDHRARRLMALVKQVD